MVNILMIFILIVAILLMLVVLVQSSKGGGLAGTFGGGDASMVFGVRRTADFLIKITTTLAVIYMSVAYKLGLPIFGVNLPKNFILAYKDEYRQHDSADEADDVLFYINPYNTI